MIYWIIQIILAILIAVTIIITVVNIVKEKNAYQKYEAEEMYGSDDEDDYDDRPVRRSKKEVASQPKREPAPRNVSVAQKNNGGNKRRWKVILQDLDTEERYSFIFCNSIGMGRTTQEAAYEDFLSLPGDRKVSKVHCAIVRSNDKLFLRDEGSRNFTFLNGKKVTKPIVIQKEDVISLGETDLEVIKILREAGEAQR